MTFVRDPVNSTGARVGDDGRLQTWAVAEPSEAAAGHDGDAYVAATVQGSGLRTLTLATVQDYALLLVRNDSDEKLLAMDTMIASCSAAGCYLYVTKNPVIGVIANADAFVPKNRNFGSSKIGDVSAWSWDEVGTAGITGFTGGEEVASIILPPAPIPVNLNAAVHLGRLNTFLISIQNPTGGAIEASVTLRFHMEPIENIV
jgi:hypothetical protein